MSIGAKIGMVGYVGMGTPIGMGDMCDIGDMEVTGAIGAIGVIGDIAGNGGTEGKKDPFHMGYCIIMGSTPIVLRLLKRPESRERTSSEEFV